MSLDDHRAERLISLTEPCIERLTEEYLAACREASGLEPLPLEADFRAFAVLSICAEHNEIVHEDSLLRILECKNTAAEYRSAGWLEIVVWDLAISLAIKRLNLAVPTRDMVETLMPLSRTLSHPNSSIRAYAFNLAWFTRRYLPTDIAARHLLKNVADTLGYWDRALGLCISLFDSIDAFQAFADAFTPPKGFDDQFADRMKCLKEEGAAGVLFYFRWLDSEVRKLITDLCLRLKVLGAVG